MTDRDRLIKLLQEPPADWEGNRSVGTIADHLLANGVIVPPCKVGDTVYVIERCCCAKPENYEMKHCHRKETKRTPKEVNSIMLLQKGRRLVRNSCLHETPKFVWEPTGTICYRLIQRSFKLEWLFQIGKTVFLTKEDAEAKLKELNGQ